MSARVKGKGGKRLKTGARGRGGCNGAYDVADGMVEEKVVARRYAMKVGVEREVEGAGGVAECSGDVLRVHLHETVAELVVLFEQQLLACLPKIVVSGHRELQGFLGTRGEHRVEQRGFGAIAIVQIVSQKRAKIRRWSDGVEQTGNARAAGAGMKRSVDKARVSHHEAGNTGALRGQAQREITQRCRNDGFAGEQVLENSGAEREIGPSVLEGGGVGKKSVGLDGIDIVVDAGHTNGTVAPAAKAFGKTKIKFRG